MSDPSQTGGNIAATLSLKQHTESATQGKIDAGGFLADVNQATHMGKDATGALSLEVFNLHGVGDLFIPKGVLSEDIGKTLGDLSKRASSPIVIGAEEAALKGANTAAHSTEFEGSGSRFLNATSGITSIKEKGGIGMDDKY